MLATDLITLLAFTTLSAAQGAAYTNQWGYVGCFPYSFGGATTGAGSTITTIAGCASYCNNQPAYYYFGVSTPLGAATEGGEFCICTNSPTSLTPVDNGLCNSTCPGHANKNCGGTNGAGYYYVSLFAFI
ncbi:WSC-domain-containing protein [Penicillium pulvis]|uniref:WSC-domain-containing protein n=1 Tax=Penicillium pulvis TaxID=1562058 RepID=UPI002548AACC|nr:WSC-domain-containing protein [Penicillium pulvis]KAJ5792954.1 WSC-domain-containing protein [Penicillium pulvis]